jgi:hypothetical protein
MGEYFVSYFCLAFDLICRGGFWYCRPAILYKSIWGAWVSEFTKKVKNSH